MEIRRTSRIAPLWATIPLLALWCIGLVACWREYVLLPEKVDWRGIVAGLPVYSMLGYGLLYALVNRVSSVITPEQIVVTVGPLPGAGPGHVVKRCDMTLCYYRKLIVHGKGGPHHFYTAGVETRNGEIVDYAADCRTLDEARMLANEVARLLNWTWHPMLPVEEFRGTPPRDKALLRRVFFWAGAFVAAMLFGAILELSR